MANPRVRGVRSSDERNANYRRDTRRLSELFSDGLADPLSTSITLVILAIVIVAAPFLAHFAPFIIGFVLWVHMGHRTHRHLPLRLPMSANMPDINSPTPGRRGFHKSKGLIYLGNAWERGNQEVWLSRDDVCTHGLMLATTGSGKSVALTGESANYIGIGGGLIYSDAKASPSLAFDIGGICRRMGREDDFLLINYMTGNRSVSASGSGERMTNTANPMASGSADSLVQIMSSLIPSPEGDNAVFGERALTMMTAVLYGLVDLRDGGHIDLGVSTLRRYLPLEEIESLAFDKRLRTETAKNALMAYMKSLPNWKPPSERIARNRAGAPIYNPDGSPQLEPINEEAGRQHGFSQMYFTRALSSLTDTYGHIFFGVLGEVDYGDVVRNRRVLVIMLPATEKSLSELQNLGKINLSAIRDAVSSGLGSRIEGSKREVVDILTAGAKIPNKIILDEAGYQSSPGFAVIAAQARSLLGGFSVIWAGQTWASIKRGSESEADEIWGNANVKLFGRLSDNESYKRLEDLVGEAKVTSTSGFAINQDSLTGGYSDTLQANVEKMRRADFTDLQEQREGEFHIVFGGEMIRVNTFYANPSPPPELRVNRFLRVGEKLAVSPHEAHSEAPPASSAPQAQSAAPIPQASAAPAAATPPARRAAVATPPNGTAAAVPPSPATHTAFDPLPDWATPMPTSTSALGPAAVQPAPPASPVTGNAGQAKSMFDTISVEGEDSGEHPDALDLAEFDQLPITRDSRKAPGYAEFAADLREQFGIEPQLADEGHDAIPDMPDFVPFEDLVPEGSPERDALVEAVDSAVASYPGDAAKRLRDVDPAKALLAALSVVVKHVDPD